jgi:hypothetical protein
MERYIPLKGFLLRPRLPHMWSRRVCICRVQISAQESKDYTRGVSPCAFRMV